MKNTITKIVGEDRGPMRVTAALNFALDMALAQRQLAWSVARPIHAIQLTLEGVPDDATIELTTKEWGTLSAFLQDDANTLPMHRHFGEIYEAAIAAAQGETDATDEA